MSLDCVVLQVSKCVEGPTADALKIAGRERSRVGWIEFIQAPNSLEFLRPFPYRLRNRSPIHCRILAAYKKCNLGKVI